MTNTERERLLKSSLELIEKAEARGHFTEADKTTLKANDRRVSEIDAEASKGQTAEDQALLAGIRAGFKASESAGGVSGAALGVAGASLRSTVDRLSSGLVKSGPDGAKALISGQATATVIAQDPATLPQVPQSVLQMVRVNALSTPVYRVLVQNARDLNAAAVEPGAVKPTSTVGLESREDRLRVVATISDGIDKYALQDTAALQALVQSELQYGVYQEVERLVLNGSGEDEEFLGVLGHSGIQVQEASGDDILTTLRKSVTKIESLGYMATGMVLNPTDWETAELSQTSGSGEYVLGSSPVDRAARRLWGVQVTTSTAVEPGTGIVADFSRMTLMTDSRGVMAEWNGQAQDDFAKNLVRLRTEGRFGFALTNPQAVVKVSLV